MDDGERDRLQELIASSDEVIAEDRDSPDPVAERRFTDALQDKGRALVRLERYADSLPVLDELLARYADIAAPPASVVRALGQKITAEAALGRSSDELITLEALLGAAAALDQSSGVEQIVAATLHRKGDLLTQLERPADALAVDNQIVSRFAARDQPQLRVVVAYALTHKARLLLRAGDAFAEAMAASDELIARVEREPAETVAPMAELLFAHVAALTDTGKSTPLTMAAHVMLVLSMTARSVAGDLARRQPLGLVEFPAQRLAQTTLRQLTPVQVDERLRRSRQAVLATEVLVGRADASDDPELKRLAVQTRLQSVPALLALGRIREARSNLALLDSSDPSVAGALQTFADLHGSASSVLNQLMAVSFLGVRARVLGAKDRYVERLAYDDSIAVHQARSPDSRAGRIFARVLRPRKGTSTIPDDASEILSS